MEPSEIQVWFAIGVAALSLGTTIYNLLTSGSRKNEKEIQLLQTQENELVKRVDYLENALANLPDRDAVHRIEIALEKMGSQIGVLDERLKPISSTTNRLNELLLDQARKSL